MQFSPSELLNIVEWKPFRSDWPIRLQESEDQIEAHYGNLIRAFTDHEAFDVVITQDGSMSNFIEIVCFIPNQEPGQHPALLVCISLCAPVAAFVEMEVMMTQDTMSLDELDFNAIGQVKSALLIPVQKAVLHILKDNQVDLLDPDYAAQLLPPDLLDKVNAPHDDNRIFHGIFQWES